MKKKVFLDVMLDDRYVATLTYPVSLKNVRQDDGKLSFSVDYSELTAFVERERPSLRGKQYRIEFTDRMPVRNGW